MISKVLFKGLNSILFVVFLLWFYFSLMHHSIDINQLPNYAIFAIFIFLGLLIIYRFLNLELSIISVYSFLIRHKKIIFIIMVVSQLIILICCSAYPRWDVGYLITLANENSPQIWSYLSDSYNNGLIALLYYTIKNVFALQFLNLVVLDLSIVYLYIVLKDLFKKSIADGTFLLFAFLLGFTPWFLLPYTDTFSFPFTISYIYALSKLLKSFAALWLIVMAIAGTLAYFLKPSLLVFMIAGVVILVIKIIHKYNSQKDLLKILAVLGVCTGIFFVSTLAQMFIYERFGGENFDKSRALSIKNFYAMGLLGNGGYNDEFRSNARKLTNLLKRDAYENETIKNRFDELGVLGYIKHLTNKFDIGVREGDFRWYDDNQMVYSKQVGGGLILQDELRESYMPKVLKPIYDSSFAKKLRKFVWVDPYSVKPHFDSARYSWIYKFYGQIVWIITSFGLFLSTIKYKESNLMCYIDLHRYLSLVILGAILFLSLFEWGRSRYLIQFLPAIVPLSVIGWERFVIYIKNIKFRRKLYDSI